LKALSPQIKPLTKKASKYVCDGIISGFPSLIAIFVFYVMAHIEKGI
jgi:hypothetical protein